MVLPAPTSQGPVLGSAAGHGCQGKLELELGWSLGKLAAGTGKPLAKGREQDGGCCETHCWAHGGLQEMVL